MFANIGSTEIVIVAFVVLILFGGRKIPEIVSELVQAIKDFRNASRE